MGHSKTAKAASRERILDAAARDVRRDGPSSLAIAPLMASVGLTHGAFYGHFETRAALKTAAVAKALADGEARFRVDEAEPLDLKTIVGRYLSRAHRDEVELGCGVVALIGDARDDPALRTLVCERVLSYVSDIERTGGNDWNPWTIWSTLIGALLLSRLFDDPQSAEILRTARHDIMSCTEIR